MRSWENAEEASGGAELDQGSAPPQRADTGADVGSSDRVENVVDTPRLQFTCESIQLRPAR